MSSFLTHRFARPVAVFVCGALVVAGCGGSESSGSDNSRTRNAGLAVSEIAMKPAVVTAVSAGWYHSLALDDAGNMYSFGWNGNGQTNVPALKDGASAFTSVVGGYRYSLALDDAGNMYAFGEDDKGQGSIPALKIGGSRFTAVAAGATHSLALDDAGNVYAFGLDTDGKTRVPVLKEGASAFTTIAAGRYHSLLLDDAGNVYAFGANWNEQTNAPALKSGASKFTDIAVGEMHSLLLDDVGNVYAFGWNRDGQTNVPALKSGASAFTAVDAGSFHSLLLDDMGNVYNFGQTNIGQWAIPALKSGASKFTAVDAGGFHSLLLDDVGNMYAFGSNVFGQGTPPPSLDAVNLRTMPIAMGGTDALALDEQGIVMNLTYSYSPTDTELVSIATNARHSLGITRSGSVVGWGDNSFGQMSIPDIEDALQVVVGYSYSAALRSDGRVVEWGSHTAAVGEFIEMPDNLPRIVSLTSGLTHVLGITSKGTVAGWGDNTNGKATPPEGLKNVVAIAANATCSVAATNEGQLSWWGSCPEVLMQKVSLPNVTAIALTDASAVAIVDGSLVIWGMNEDQSADLEQDVNIVKEGSTIRAISAGGAAFLAIDQNGNVTSWGTNWSNTITIPESFGGPVPIVNDNICEDCEQPEGFTDNQLDDEILPFFIEVLTPEQKAKVIGALGGSTTKPLTLDEIQALIDAAKKEGRTEALATVREVVVASNTPAVGPATTTASTLPASQSPTTKVNTAITTKRAVTLLGLKKVTKVAFVVPKKASARACAVTKTKVTTTAAGVCNVKVTYTDAKKKRRTTTLTLVVG